MATKVIKRIMLNKKIDTFWDDMFPEYAGSKASNVWDKYSKFKWYVSKIVSDEIKKYKNDLSKQNKL